MPALKALGRLLPYYRPYRSNVAIGLGLVIVSSALASVVPLFLRRALDGIRAGVALRNIWLLAVAMVGVSLFAGVLRYWMRDLLNGVSRWIEYDLRNALYAALEALDPSYYARTRTGDLMARMTNDLSAVRMAVGPAIMYLTNTIAGGAFALFFMLRIDARLTMIATLPMLLLPIVGIWMGKQIHERFEAVQEYFGELTTLAQENLSGVRVVRAYRQETSEIRRFDAMNDEYLEKNMRLVRLYGAMHPAFVLLAGLGMVAVLWIGGALTIRGAISVGSFVAFGLYLGMLTWPLIALGWVINLFQRGAASMARLLDILDTRSLLLEPTSRRALPLTTTNAGRTIEFRDDFVRRRRAWVFGQVMLEVLQGPTLSLWTETAFISTTGGSFTVRASGRETTFVSVRSGTARLRALNDESDPAYRSVTIGAGQRAFAVRLVGAKITSR